MDRLHHLAILALTLTLGASAAAQTVTLRPTRLYFGANRPLPFQLSLDAPTGADAPTPRLEIAIIDPRTGAVRERAELAHESISASDIDLAELFPVLWTGRHARTLYAQTIIDGRPAGCPVVLQPIITPPAHTDEMTARVMRAFLNKDAQELTRLLLLSSRTIEENRRRVATPDTTGERTLISGIRAYPLSDVVLHTDEGTIRLALEPAEAPNTAFHFARLVDDGFYTDVAFHRVINADANGRPFIIQAGDPTGTGRGGSGSPIDFEPSAIPHARGVVSLARHPDDPNSADSQFFICLARDTAARLDGLYASFARVVDGLETVDAIASAPVVPTENPDDVPHTPLEPVVIHHATLVPAPPFRLDPEPAPRQEQDDSPVVR